MQGRAQAQEALAGGRGRGVMEEEQAHFAPRCSESHSLHRRLLKKYGNLRRLCKYVCVH